MTEVVTCKLTSWGAVRIVDGQRNPVYSKKSLIQTIANVQERRDAYATEEAFRRDLNKFQGALDFLNSS